jgi:hypothetical protein
MSFIVSDLHNYMKPKSVVERVCPAQYGMVPKMVKPSGYGYVYVPHDKTTTESMGFSIKALAHRAQTV